MVKLLSLLSPPIVTIIYLFIGFQRKELVIIHIDPILAPMLPLF
jgi:hypothetical protein